MLQCLCTYLILYFRESIFKTKAKIAGSMRKCNCNFARWCQIPFQFYYSASTSNMAECLNSPSPTISPKKYAKLLFFLPFWLALSLQFYIFNLYFCKHDNEHTVKFKDHLHFYLWTLYIQSILFLSGCGVFPQFLETFKY